MNKKISTDENFLIYDSIVVTYLLFACGGIHSSYKCLAYPTVWLSVASAAWVSVPVPSPSSVLRTGPYLKEPCVWERQDGWNSTSVRAANECKSQPPRSCDILVTLRGLDHSTSEAPFHALLILLFWRGIWKDAYTGPCPFGLMWLIGGVWLAWAGGFGCFWHTSRSATNRDALHGELTAGRWGGGKDVWVHPFSLTVWWLHYHAPACPLLSLSSERVPVPSSCSLSLLLACFMVELQTGVIYEILLIAIQANVFAVRIVTTAKNITSQWLTWWDPYCCWVYSRGKDDNWQKLHNILICRPSSVAIILTILFL